MPIVTVTIPSKHSTARSCIIELPEPIPINLPLTPTSMTQSSSSTSFLNADLKPCGQSSPVESDCEMPRPAVQENHFGSTDSLSSLLSLFEPALSLITQKSHQKNSKSLEAGATEDLTSNNECNTAARKGKRGKASLFFPDSSPYLGIVFIRLTNLRPTVRLSPPPLPTRSPYVLRFIGI